MPRNPLVFDPAHPDARPAAATAGGLYGDALRQYILRRAPQLNLDPYVPLAIAPHEGGFAGAIGDQGTSFGPGQLHIGGALPAEHVGDARAWANSTAGVDYWLSGLAKTLGGRRGTAGVAAGVREFERPAAQYVPGEIGKATATYQELAGSGGAAVPAPAATPRLSVPTPPSVSQGDWTTALAGRSSADWVGALSGRSSVPAAPAASWVDALSGQPRARARVTTPPPGSQPGKLPLSLPNTVTQPPASYTFLKPRDATVSLEGVDPKLLAAANAFAQAIGQPVVVTSGKRSRAEQAALYARYKASGFDRSKIAAQAGQSNHEFGKALDITVGGQSVGLTRYARLLPKYGLHLSVPGDYPHVTLASVRG